MLQAFPGLRTSAPTATPASSSAEEIAAIASFLLSRDASYITGTTIDASGGRT
ncbi:SDR family oxidoreductase [Mycobacterium sp. HUMS_1102779]